MAAPSFLLITDRQNAALPLDQLIPQVLDAGCRWIMVREKDLKTAEIRPLLDSIADLAKEYNATVTVNRDYTAASLCNLPGVHLPQGEPVSAIRKVLGVSRLIGVSAHNLTEAQAAVGEGANYVTLSPIFETQSKPGYGPALGLEGLTAVAKAVPVPVLALGGVTAANAADCVRAGAAGVAVMGEVMRSSTPGDKVRKIIQALAGAAA